MNQRPITSVVVCMCLFSLCGTAQLAIGDIAIARTVNNYFMVLPGAGGAAQTYNTPVFGAPSSTGTSQAILLDRYHPNALVIGGFNFVGRATVTGPGASSWSLLTNAVGTVAQMSFDASGNVVIADAGVDQVRLLDLTTNTVTNVTSGAQPWGTSVNAGAVDVTTGDIYVGASGSIYRIPAGTNTPVLFATGLSSFVSWIAFDPFTNAVVASILNVNRVVRFTPAGVGTDLCTPGAITAPNALDVDQNGDFVVAVSSGGVYRIPNAGGAPTLIGSTPTASNSIIAGIAVVKPEGFHVYVSAAAGGGTIALAGIPTATVEGFTVASLDVSLPVGQGPVVGISPDALTYALLLGAPSPTPGDLVHWTWPVAPPLYPALAFTIPPGAVTGLTADFVAIAFDVTYSFTIAPAVRVTF